MGNSFITDFDALAVLVFKSAGLADAAVYTAPGAAPIACTVLIDDDLQIIGQVSSVGDKTKIFTLYKAEVGAPLRNARVVIGAISYILVDRTIDDDSRSVWIARHE